MEGIYPLTVTLTEKEYNYTYEEGRIVRATECDITVTNEAVTSKTLVNTVRYIYDTDGNLTKKIITPTGGSAFEYAYVNSEDSNPVVKFSAGGRTVTSHSKTDSFGRKVFDELQLGAAIETKSYGYSSVGNRDRLITYGGYTLSYDAMGNPIAYMGNNLTWERGTLLSGFGDYKYTYDASGKRISKDVGGAETVFEYDGDRLMSSVKFGQIINFFYDLTGVRGFKNNGSNYFYEKNLQGDIS